MSSLNSSSDIRIVLHTTATDLLVSVEPFILPNREREANIWLPHARKTARREQRSPQQAESSNMASTVGVANQQKKASQLDQFWLSCWSPRRGTSNAYSLDFILACTSSLLGPYPIFLYANLLSRLLTFSFLSERIPRLVDRLAGLVKTSRVFSVFGPTPVTQAFVTSWSRQTCSDPFEDAFYAAKFSTCTRDSLAPVGSPLPFGHTLQLAGPQDEEAAAVLCKEFADDSVFFPLEYSDALKEAKEMIRNQQLWTYYIQTPNGGQVLACIVACTRTTENVVAVNKVYTNLTCRSQGWLFGQRKDSVVLYVAHDNEPAERAYHRVGFGGLCGTPTAEFEVEDWLEIGFKNTERGHW
ncbi:hypothetical protein FRB97_009838 [Tulasnella sp. 331]|nr:hypothetical protein FRB97_009838 [Tulasnella sp. 331]KAG8886569.1 hypothetical protein FRB98_001217 [Tulasnella sp. 332]